MALGRALSPFTLVPAERQGLLEWSRGRKTAQALAWRARIVRLCAERLSNIEVARRVRVTGATVCKWRQRLSFSAWTDCSMNPVRARRAA